MVVRILTQEVDFVEKSRRGFKTPGCNWQLGLGPLAFGLEKVTLPHKTYTFRGLGSGKKTEGCGY